MLGFLECSVTLVEKGREREGEREGVRGRGRKDKEREGEREGVRGRRRKAERERE